MTERLNLLITTYLEPEHIAALPGARGNDPEVYDLVVAANRGAATSAGSPRRPATVPATKGFHFARAPRPTGGNVIDSGSSSRTWTSTCRAARWRV